MKSSLLFLFIISIVLNFYLISTGWGNVTDEEGRTYRDTIEYVDTVPFYFAVPKDSVVIRYVTEKLPAVNGKEDNFPTKKDSVDVEIPITQKMYEGQQFRAYISGYQPRIDSVFVYTQKQVVRIRDEPKRFSVGFSAGYGLTPAGLQPYIGLGVTYKLFRF